MAELFDSLASHTGLRTTFVQYLITFYSRLEETSDIISGGFVEPVVAENPVQFGDPSLDLSREIPHEASFSAVFRTLITSLLRFG